MKKFILETRRVH